MTVRTDIYMTVCVKAFPLTDKDVLSSPSAAWSEIRVHVAAPWPISSREIRGGRD